MINIVENIGGNISDVGISNSLASVLELPVMFLFIKILNKRDIPTVFILWGAYARSKKDLIIESFIYTPYSHKERYFYGIT